MSGVKKVIYKQDADGVFRIKKDSPTPSTPPIVKEREKEKDKEIKEVKELTKEIKETKKQDKIKQGIDDLLECAAEVILTTQVGSDPPAAAESIAKSAPKTPNPPASAPRTPHSEKKTPKSRDRSYAPSVHTNHTTQSKLFVPNENMSSKTRSPASELRIPTPPPHAPPHIQVPPLVVQPKTANQAQAQFQAAQAAQAQAIAQAQAVLEAQAHAHAAAQAQAFADAKAEAEAKEAAEKKAFEDAERAKSISENGVPPLLSPYDKFRLYMTECQFLSVENSSKLHLQSFFIGIGSTIVIKKLQPWANFYIDIFLELFGRLFKLTIIWVIIIVGCGYALGLNQRIIMSSLQALTTPPPQPNSPIVEPSLPNPQAPPSPPVEIPEVPVVQDEPAFPPLSQIIPDIQLPYYIPPDYPPKLPHRDIPIPSYPLPPGPERRQSAPPTRPISQSQYVNQYMQQYDSSGKISPGTRLTRERLQQLNSNKDMLINSRRHSEYPTMSPPSPLPELIRVHSSKSSKSNTNSGLEQTRSTSPSLSEVPKIIKTKKPKNKTKKDPSSDLPLINEVRLSYKDGGLSRSNTTATNRSILGTRAQYNTFMANTLDSLDDDD